MRCAVPDRTGFVKRFMRCVALVKCAARYVGIGRVLRKEFGRVAWMI